jgi:hypothetical protein
LSRDFIEQYSKAVDLWKEFLPYHPADKKMKEDLGGMALTIPQRFCAFSSTSPWSRARAATAGYAVGGCTEIVLLLQDHACTPGVSLQAYQDFFAQGRRHPFSNTPSAESIAESVSGAT